MTHGEKLAWILGAFVLAAPAVVSLVGTLLALGIARCVESYDVPSERSSHSVPTPRAAGIPIVLGVMAGLVLTHLGERFDGPGPFDSIAGVALATLLACCVGFLDDLRPLRPRTKFGLFLFPVMFAGAGEALGHVRGVPFAGEIDLSWASLPLVLLWLACYPHAFNFMDGIDGIAGVTAVVSGAGFAVAGLQQRGDGPRDVGTAGLAVATACLGFLPVNFPKARIFMGDAGSLPLGLLLAWLAVRSNATGTISFPASILLLGPFIFDVAFTLFRRWREGKTIGEAHKEHLYQRLSRVWNSHAKVSLLYAGFSVVTGVLALNYGGMSDLGKLLSLTLPLAAMLGFAAFVLRAEREKGR